MRIFGLRAESAAVSADSVYDNRFETTARGATIRMRIRVLNDDGCMTGRLPDRELRLGKSIIIAPDPA